MPMETNKKPILSPSIPSDIDFPFLERTIEILVVDDEPCILELHSKYLSHYKLYNVSKASCAKEARAVFLSQKRIHVCIMDLGLTDINNDEYYLIREFSSISSFIVVTEMDSLEAGFNTGCLGTCAVIKKPINFKNPLIFKHINKAFLQSAFKKGVFKKCKPVIIDAVEALISNKPTEMKLWIEMLNVDERYLRKVWVKCFGYQPRYLLFLFNTFLKAFEYYTNLYFKELGLKNEPEEILPDNFEYVNKRFKMVYQKHQKEIDRILRE